SGNTGAERHGRDTVMNPKQKIEPPASFQEMLLRLEQFWSGYACALVQPYSSEVGAGTFNPATFFRVLGPEPWKAAYVEPSRRPKDGRYGQNPNRLQMFYQHQGVDRIMDLRWSRDIRWDELFLTGEVEWSTFNFEQSNPELLFEQFEKMEREAERLLEAGLVLPGYDYVIKCSHLFNLLEARGAISVTERV